MSTDSEKDYPIYNGYFAHDKYIHPIEAINLMFLQIRDTFKAYGIPAEAEDRVVITVNSPRTSEGFISSWVGPYPK